jgi:hypothetical protein
MKEIKISYLGDRFKVTYDKKTLSILKSALKSNEKICKLLLMSTFKISIEEADAMIKRLKGFN